MKPTLCSRCKKNVAVVFITRLDNNGQGSHNEGLCLKCAQRAEHPPGNRYDRKKWASATKNWKV